MDEMTHRFTAYVIEDKIVIKDNGSNKGNNVFTALVQMNEHSGFNAKSWAEWLTFCLNYWEENYKTAEVGLADTWFQVKVLKEIQPD